MNMHEIRPSWFGGGTKLWRNRMVKFGLACFSVLIIGACAVKEHSPDIYKDYTAKQILQRGEQAVAKHNYREAIKYFEAIDALYPFDPEAQQGQLKVIGAYYKDEDYASTIAAASRYIHLYPEGKNTDYAYYMIGLANFSKDQSVLHKLYPRKPEKLDISNLQDAFDIFEELLKKFPHSVYAKDAAGHMAKLQHLLVEHDLHIVRFYFKHKAYVAAINRANDIVKHFDSTPQVKEALKIMVKSYRALGIDKQANDALHMLQEKFPHERIERI